MAHAYEVTSPQVQPNGLDTGVRYVSSFVLVGSEIPGGSLMIEAATTVDASSNAATINNNRIAAVRAAATASGVTVPANGVVLFPISRG